MEETYAVVLCAERAGLYL